MSYEIESKGPVDALKRMLFDNEIKDLFIDITEMGIDSLLQDKEEIIKSFPVMKTVYTSGKIIISIRDLFLTKKVMIFVQSVQKRSLSNTEISKHVNQLKSDQARLNKELEIILTYLDRQTKYIKTVILANFYLQYLAEIIDWDEFDYFAEIVDAVSVYDLKVLKIVWDKNIIKEGEKYNPVSLQRLRNHGLVEYHDGVAVKKEEIVFPYIASINEIGSYFCEYGMDGVWDMVMEHGIIV